MGSGGRDQLRKEIREDKTISDVTRRELFDELGEKEENFAERMQRGKKGFADEKSLRKTFTEAREGISDKFRSRQAFQKRKGLIEDRPGQRQLRGTLLSKVNPTSPSGDEKKKKKPGSLLTDDLGIASPLGK